MTYCFSDLLFLSAKLFGPAANCLEDLMQNSAHLLNFVLSRTAWKIFGYKKCQIASGCKAVRAVYKLWTIRDNVAERSVWNEKLIFLNVSNWVSRFGQCRTGASCSATRKNSKRKFLRAKPESFLAILCERALRLQVAFASGLQAAFRAFQYFRFYSLPIRTPAGRLRSSGSLRCQEITNLQLQKHVLAFWKSMNGKILLRLSGKKQINQNWFAVLII